MSRTITNIDKARLNRRLINLITLSNILFYIASNNKLYTLLNKVLPSASKLLIKTYYTIIKHIKKEYNFY
jgi:transcriptional regulator